ncbi:angiopoietin-2-like isoform X2 [Synchiropus splendidus]|uniref:angiopoietin-2-like isoform X2 n=1 Tax=Synchiropus splendidus TaxID=270530 RepID=UPI00237E3B73|nr:angiopoietin-2-like isoform X2 [Synchiropus splendidus]
MKMSIFLSLVLRTSLCFIPGAFRDQPPDAQHNSSHSSVHNDNSIEDSDFNIHLDTQEDEEYREANPLFPELSKDNYEDADWHRPKYLQETHSEFDPDAPLVTRSSAHSENSLNKIQHQTSGRPLATCGEHSSQLSDGQCRLTATLPPVGKTEKRCPDMFRCTDDISFWLHENQNRKEQLTQLKETLSEQQEELRDHRYRVSAIEGQVRKWKSEKSNVSDPTLVQRLRELERRHSETSTLLHVHSMLLQELQVQLQNLSATMQHVSRSCMVNVVDAAGSPNQRDSLAPGGQYLSLCPSDCASLFHNGVRRSGVYTIVLSPGVTSSVYCDMETEGGGWTVFQRRSNGSLSFNRGWSEYRDGFGEPHGEHWLGNQQLHQLTSKGRYGLRIDMEDWSNAHKHALYRSFSIEDEENRFRLHVSGFSGTVEDSFGWYHDRRSFSTPDTGDICAEISHAGWWFHQCFYANLNGVYYKGGHYTLKAENALGPDGMVWFSWKDSDFYSLKSVSMMIRPRDFRTRPSP